MSNYISLHNHTEFSFLDGMSKIKSLVKKAVDLNMPAIAITDHGGMFGVMEFFMECQTHGIKPILGYEAYITLTNHKDRSSDPLNKPYHLCLWAKNLNGYRNLIKMCSLGYLEGFYKKPRIDKNILTKYKDGIIVGSGCIGGAIAQATIKSDFTLQGELLEYFLMTFGADFYLELQNHGIDDEIKFNNSIVSTAKKHGIPIIATNDSHYTNKTDAIAHDTLLCMQTKAKIDDKKRFKFPNSEFYFKNDIEMRELFSKNHEFISNTELLSNTIQQYKITDTPKLPTIQLSNQTPQQDLIDICFKNLSKKYPQNYLIDIDIIKNRVNFELGIINTMGFTGYFLIFMDIMQYTDSIGVMRGCRGSAAGSIVAYLLGITNIDPLKYNLLFERFLNPERISMPDIDADFATSSRYLIYDYVKEKYGIENVSKIINFTRSTAKMIWKDTARCYGMPPKIANDISKLILEKTLKLSLECNDELNNVINSNDDYKNIYKIAKKLEGTVRQPSIHAGGVIISPSPIDYYAPRYISRKPGSEIVVQYDMSTIEQTGLIKMDFLGLKTFEILQNVCKIVKKRHGKDYDIWDLPLDDKKVFKLFASGNLTTIFQFESNGMQSFIKKLKPTNIEDIAAMSALYRPGAIDSIGSFIDRKNGTEKVEYLHPCLKDILDVTYGIIVYQEQVMRIAQDMGGFSLGQADILRKAMSKKQEKKMLEMKIKFISGAARKKIDKNIAKKTYLLMAKFAKYGFNKAHATVYAHVSYQAAYFKTHYIKEWALAVMLGNNTEDKIIDAKNIAEKMGVKVEPPNINNSMQNCSIHNDNIIVGFDTIKKVGKSAGTIINNRPKSGYKDFFEFFDKCNINKGAIESLLKSGCFCCSDNDTSMYLHMLQDKKFKRKSQKKQAFKYQTKLFDFENSNIILPTDFKKYSKIELFNFEKEVLGYYATGNPIDIYKKELEIIDNHIDSNFFFFAGIVEKVKLHQDKNNNTMAFLSVYVSKLNAVIDCTVFSKLYKTVKNFCVSGSQIIIKSKDNTDKIVAITIYDIKDTNKLFKKPKNTTVCFDINNLFVADLYFIKKNDNGNIRVILTGNNIKFKTLHKLTKSSVKKLNNLIKNRKKL